MLWNKMVFMHDFTIYSNIFSPENFLFPINTSLNYQLLGTCPLPPLLPQPFDIWNTQNMSEKLSGFCWNTIYSIPVSKFYQTIELKHTTLYYKNWFLFKVGNFHLTAHSNWVIKHNHIFFRTFFKPHNLFSIRFFNISLIIIPWIRISLSDMQWQKNKAKLFYIFKGVLYSDTLL